MSDTPNPNFRSSSEDLIPVVMIRLSVALVVTVVALVTVARLSGWEISSGPPPAPPVAERAIVLESQGGGAVRVLDADGQMIADLPSINAGFIFSIERVLFRERQKHSVAHDAPIFIQRRANGALTIHDPETGHVVDLSAFGTDNIQSFARLLEQP